MKILYLLRHAKSSWRDPSQADFDRPLSGRGRRAGKLVANHMESRGLHPAIVLCSAAERTCQTIDLIRPALGEEVRIENRRPLYLAEPSTILAELATLPDDIPSAMVVAHNPGLHDLAVALASSGDPTLLKRLGSKFPTGALVVLTSEAANWKDIRNGGLHLEDFVRPRDLE